MFPPVPPSYLLPLALLLVLSSCGTSPSAQERASDRDVQTEGADVDTERLESLFWERQRSSRDRFTEADEHFMVGMIAHHSQALIMTELARNNMAGDDVLQMARRIENTQFDEIDTMQQWLRDRSLPVPIVTIDGIDMSIEMESADDAQHESDQMHHDDMETDTETDGGMHSDSSDAMAHHHNMPGMLTRDQLARMAEATGEHFDELFLRYMIEHHEGAIYMVQELLASEGAAQHPETFRLASDIHADQQMEIERMEQMLLTMGVYPMDSRENDPHDPQHTSH
ncbi:MAG: DUF305 domain-containing protein [Bacteroidota bacterium]